MNSELRRSAPRAALALALLLGLTACAPGAAPTGPAAPPAGDADAHDVGAGDATEVARPALALVVADERGTLTLIDLETEERTALGDERDGVADVTSDGRLLYVAPGDGSAVDVIDAGRWTMPHGDHTHSFVGEPGLVGTIEPTDAADTAVHVDAGAQAATIRFGDEIVLLSHDDLAAVDEAPRLDLPAAGPVLSFAEHLLVPGAAGAIEVRDAAGALIPAAGVPCTGAVDADITRVGAVFSCAEGAVLFTREVGGAIAGEAIPYPAGVTGATPLAGRTGRPDLSGIVPGQGAWLLDVRARTWTPLPSDVPLLRAVAVGDDDGRTVAVDAEGRVRILGPDGTVLARTEPLLAASLADPAALERVQLLVDARHAYLSDPAAGAVYELDHTDDARLTRTFSDLEPWSVHQVG